MANMLDYLYFRKDISFQQKPFNHVDALILSELAYVEWDGLVEKQPVSLVETCQKYFDANENTDLASEYAYSLRIPNLIKAVGEATRYQNIMIGNYMNVFDEEKVIQFAACTFSLPSYDTLFIAYRGTDSSMLGWKEDMEMTYHDEISSHTLAAAYVDEIIRDLPEESSFFGLRKQKVKPKIYFGGHSKGGNLAVYAYLKHPELHEQIKCVYNFDGPGFRESFLEEYKNPTIWNKVASFIPRCSIIGRLLAHVDTPKILDAEESGLAQHDPFCWHVDVNDFIYVHELDEESDKLNAYIDQMLMSKEDAQKEDYINMVFLILDKLEIHQISDLSEINMKKAMSGMLEIASFNSEERKFLLEIIKFLFTQTKDILMKPNK